MKYSVDTSALVDAWTRYYPKDVFPGIWQRIEHLADNQIISASQMVLPELERKDDDLLAWAKSHDTFFVPIDESIQIEVANILAQRSFKKLIDQRPNRTGADPFVIALAKIHGYSVLTGEKPTGSPNRPHIPDVCQALGIPWFSMLDLFRQQKWSFH